jgi:Cu+-exporting ATPase
LIFKSIEADETFSLEAFEEIKGKGIRALINGKEWRIGSANFVLEREWEEKVNTSVVHVMADSIHLGYFTFKNRYREQLTGMVEGLKAAKYELHILSGDNDSEREVLTSIFGTQAQILFNQTPQNKLDYIAALQNDKHRNVMMLGDGLNDAGALRQANVGIAVTDQTGLFTPACDAILEGSQLTRLDTLMRYAREQKAIVGASFVLSILYNVVGESYAVSANLSPIVAAVLMPISSISVIAFVTLLSSYRAKRVGLEKN